jgi:hypothetical protein
MSFFKNGKKSPPATSEAGARWPRRGGVFIPRLRQVDEQASCQLNCRKRGR